VPAIAQALHRRLAERGDVEPSAVGVLRVDDLRAPVVDRFVVIATDPAEIRR